MMNDSTPVMRRPRRAWLADMLIAAAILALVLLAVPACSGGSPSSTGPSGSPAAGASKTSTSAVAYSHCVRSHGVPNYPDPGTGGTLPKADPQRLGVSSSQLQTAQRTCQHLLPTAGGSLTATSLRQCYLAYVCPQALVQRAMNAGQKFAHCMRSHGVLNWPDPTIDAQGRPSYNITVPRPTPAHIATAINECSRLEHAGSLLAWG
jgi:hypothetical protein